MLQFAFSGIGMVVVVVVDVVVVVVSGALMGTKLGSITYEAPYQRSGSPQQTPALTR